MLIRILLISFLFLLVSIVPAAIDEDYVTFVWDNGGSSNSLAAGCTRAAWIASNEDPSDFMDVATGAPKIDVSGVDVLSADAGAAIYVEHEADTFFTTGIIGYFAFNSGNYVDGYYIAEYVNNATCKLNVTYDIDTTVTCTIGGAVDGLESVINTDVCDASTVNCFVYVRDDGGQQAAEIAIVSGGGIDLTRLNIIGTDSAYAPLPLGSYIPYHDNAAALSVNIFDITVKNVTMENFAASNVHGEASSSTYYAFWTNGHSTIFRNCRGVNASAGFFSQGSSTILIDCVAYDNNGYQVYFAQHGQVIIGGYFEKNRTKAWVANDWVIYFAGIGATIDGAILVGDEYGIRFSSYGAHIVKNCVFVGQTTAIYKMDVAASTTGQIISINNIYYASDGSTVLMYDGSYSSMYEMNTRTNIIAANSKLNYWHSSDSLDGLTITDTSPFIDAAADNYRLDRLDSEFGNYFEQGHQPYLFTGTTTLSSNIGPYTGHDTPEVANVLVTDTVYGEIGEALLGGNLVSTPILEYRTADEFTSSRATAFTAAFDSTIPAATVPITKTVTSTSISSQAIFPSNSTDFVPMAIDQTRDLILATKNDKKFYTITWDGETMTPTVVFELLVDDARNPDWDFYDNNNRVSIKDIFVSDVGTWFCSLGDYLTAPVTDTILSKIYRSTDAGATWSALPVVTTDYGSFQPMVQCDGFLAAGCYTNYTPENWHSLGNPTVVSYDDGLTWKQVHSNASIDPRTGLVYEEMAVARHCHGVTGGHGNSMLLSWGDGPSTLAVYVTMPNGWTTGDWDIEFVNSAWTQNKSIFENGVFYTGCSGGGTVSSSPGRVVALSPLNDWKQSYSLILADDISATEGYNTSGPEIDSGPYKYTSDSGCWMRSPINVDGTYYAFTYGYATGSGLTDFRKSIGMYVSRDLKTWTAAYRAPTANFGEGRNEGVYKGKWMVQVAQSYPGDVVTNNFAFVPVSNAAMIEAPSVSLGNQNFIGMRDINRSMFVTDLGGDSQPWGYNGGTPPHDERRDLTWDATGGILDSGCINIQYLAAAASDHGSYIGASYLSYMNDDLGGTTKDHFTVGTFFSWSNYIRSDVDCPEFWIATPRIYQTSNFHSQNYFYLLNESWQHLISTGYVHTDGGNTIPITLLETGTIISGDFSNVPSYDTNVEGLLASEFYFDNASMFLSQDRWLSYSLPMSVPGTDPFTSVDDFLSVDLIPATEWSLTFEWYPFEGVANFPHVDEAWHTSIPLPIASIVGTGGTYIDINWNRQDQKFEIIDNNSDTIQINPPVVPIRWLHYDSVKFALTSDGTDTQLYMFSPENMRENGELIMLASGLNVNITNPTSLKLGTNFAENDIGCGAFTNVRYWRDEVIDANGVLQVFDTPTPMRINRPSKSNPIFGGSL